MRELCTYEEFYDYFVTLPLKELRRRQDLCSQQLRIAHNKRLTDALTELQTMELALGDAVYKVTQ